MAGEYPRSNAIRAAVSGTVDGLTVVAGCVAHALTPPVSGRFHGLRIEGGMASDYRQVGRDLSSAFRQVIPRAQERR